MKKSRIVLNFRIFFNEAKYNIFSKTLNFLRNNLFLIVLQITLSFLAFKSYLYLLINLVYCLYLYKKEKIIFYISSGVTLIIILHLAILNLRHITPKEEITGVITKVEVSENVQKLYIDTDDGKVLVYDYDFCFFSVGMKGNFIGSVVNIDGQHIENEFDYQEYLKHKRISFVLTLKEYTISDKVFVWECVSVYVHQYFDTHFEGTEKIFLKALLIGDDSGFSEEFNESIRKNGILHLFAISGSHITMFVGVLAYVFKKLKIKDKIGDILIYLFLILYLIITAFSPSIFRATCMFMVANVFKRKKISLTLLDCESMVYILLLVYNPFYFYDLGFALSFLMSFGIILSIYKLRDLSFLKQSLYVSTLSFFISLPLVVSVNYEVNVFSIFLNIIFVLMIEGIILPFSFVVCFLPFLNKIYYYALMSFIKGSYFFSEYYGIILKFRKFSTIEVLLYYFLWYMLIRLLKEKKWRKLLSFLLCGYILGLSVFSNFSYWGEVHFLDLKNGESTIIMDRLGGPVIVIDTGDGTHNAVSNFLKSKGIKKIDLLIITHNHNDHNGEVLTILKEFKVTKIVISAYDNSVLKNLSNVQKVRTGDVLTVKDFIIHIVHPNQKYENENDNSIVLLMRISNKKFLFMGDATKKVEEQLLFLDVDVLKVGHHGSNTSTSDKFIKSVSPEYAIVQTGRITKFGFPHSEVIKILNENKITIYRTDINYSIKFRFNQKTGIFSSIK